MLHDLPWYDHARFAAAIEAGPEADDVVVDFTATQYWGPDRYAIAFRALATHAVRSLSLVGMRFRYTTDEADDVMRDMMDYHTVDHDADQTGPVIQAIGQAGLPPTLRRFSMVGVPLSPADLPVLLLSLPAGLESLDLTGCDLGTSGLRALPPAHLGSLTELSLGWSELDDEQARTIASNPGYARLGQVRIRTGPGLGRSGRDLLEDRFGSAVWHHPPEDGGGRRA